MKNTVAIIDYGTNNILSILKAFKRIDVKAEVVTNYKKLKNFNNCILPGVGSFDKAIENLDCKKRPVSAVADNFEVKNAKSVKIQINKKIKFILLYNKHSSLEKKIKIEQIRKETKSN